MEFLREERNNQWMDDGLNEMWMVEIKQWIDDGMKEKNDERKILEGRVL